MTIQVAVVGGESVTVPSGGSFALEPGMVLQISLLLPNGSPGSAIDPALITAVVDGSDVILTLPNGETLLLENGATLMAQAGLGEVVMTGEQVAAVPSPEELEPAAGPGAGGGGAGGAGGGSSQAVSTFIDDGFGNLFGLAPSGDFAAFGGPGALGLLDPEDSLGAGPVPQPVTFTLGMTMGLEDQPIQLAALVSQNDLEGLGETLTLVIRGIPEGVQILDVDGNLLFTGPVGGGSYSVPAVSLMSLYLLPTPDNDADFTLSIDGTTAEPTNPDAGTVTVTASVPVVVKAVADLATFTVDDLLPADHPDGIAKNPVQIELEGRGGSGANDVADKAQDLGTLPAPTADNPNPVVTVDGWTNINDPNDVDLYKVTLTQAGTFKFELDFGDHIAPEGANGRIDQANLQLFLFDAATGALIAGNDDENFPVVIDPLVVQSLAAGDYMVAVTVFGNDPIGANLADGFTGGGTSAFGGSGDYELQIQLDGADNIPGDMVGITTLEDKATESAGMWMDGATPADRTQSADVALAVSDSDGSESLTRVAISLDQTPPGFQLDIDGDGIFLTGGTNTIDLQVTRILVDGDPAVADTISVTVTYDAASGGAAFEINPALRVQSIDLTDFSWLVQQHDDLDFMLSFEVRSTETNPSEGSTLDESQVATPHAYQTGSLAVNNQAVADKPTLTIGASLVAEDNATLNGMGMYDDGTPIYTVPLTAAVTDMDGSESLTQVQLNSSDVNAAGGQPTYDGTPVYTLLGNMPNGTLILQVDRLDAGGTPETVNVNVDVAFNGQGITLTFDPADRVQSIDMSKFGVQLPQHLDGRYDITLIATATETNPSEAGDVAVLSQTQSETFTLDIEAVADKATVVAADVSFNEDKAVQAMGMYADGTPVYAVPFSAAVTDQDGSESITRIVLDSPEANAVGGQPTFGGILVADIWAGQGTFPAGTLQIEVTHLDAGGAPVTETVTATGFFNPQGITLDFDPALRVQSIASGEFGLQLPQHKDGIFTVEWQAVTTETDPLGVVKAGAGTATLSGTLDITVGAVADKATVTAADVTVKEDNATDSGGGVYVDGSSIYAVPFTASVTDSDLSESITQVVINATDVNAAGGQPTYGATPVAVLWATAGNPLAGTLDFQAVDETGATVTVTAQGFFNGQGIALSFDASDRIQSVDLAPLGIQLPAHRHGDFTLDWQVVTTETNAMEPGSIVAATATQSGSLELKVEAVADKPVFSNLVANATGPVNSAIALDASFAIPDADGSEGLSQLQVSGLPDGASISFIGPTGAVTTITDGDIGSGDDSGTPDGIIAIDLTLFQGVVLAGITLGAGGKVIAVDSSAAGIDLAVTPPAGFGGPFTATLTATSTEMVAPISVASQSDSVDIQVQVGAPPVLDLDGDDSSGASGADFATSYSENAPAISLRDTDITLTDADSTGISRIVFRLVAPPDGVALEVLLPSGPVGGSTSLQTVVTVVGGDHVITVTPVGSGTIPIADAILALELIQYSHLGDDPTAGDRSVEVQVFDEFGIASNVGTATVTVVPVNDPPVANDDMNALTEDSGVTTALGDVRDGDGAGGVADTDPDNDTSDLTVIEVNGVAGNVGMTIAGTYGELTLNDDGSYSYALDNDGSAVQGLGAGETQTDSFTYTIDDPDGLTDTATLDIKVTGVNDAPLLDLDADGSNTADPSLDFDAGQYRAGGAPIAIVDGDASVSDVDSNIQNITVTFAGGSNADGASELLAVTVGASGLVVTNIANGIQITGPAAPSVFQSVLQTLTYENAETAPTYGVRNIEIVATDDEGGSSLMSATATATVEVAPPQVFFIDNDPAHQGGTGTGSDIDPYHSIADFNAAVLSGGPDDPQPGDFVFLRSGATTYDEADGINLADGQTLIGQGQALGFGSFVNAGAGSAPVINVTGANNHGIELAQDNTIRGLIVGNTGGSGAGIDDGGHDVGSLTISDVTIQGSGKAFDVDQGGRLDVTLNSVTSTGSSSEGIDIEGVAAGSSFTVAGGTSITGFTGAGNGVDLTSNGGSTFSFTGLTLTANGSGGGFNASGGGTVSLGGTGNSVTTTTGTAVSIVNSTIGIEGVTFQSVSSAGGSETGIILDNAGSGGFTITGTGAAGSGGTIANKIGADGATGTGVGIYINNTNGVELNDMQLNDFQNFAIRGANVTGFTLSDSTINGVNGNSTGDDEGSVSFSNLLGTALIEGSTIAGGLEDNLRVVNSSGTLDRLTVQDSSSNQMVVGLNSSASGNDGIFVESQGSATLNVSVVGTQFVGARGDLFQGNALGNSTMDVVLRDNDFTNNHPNIVSAGGGITLSGGGAGSNIAYTYLVEGTSGAQTFAGADGNSITANFVGGAGNVSGTIRNNEIGTSGVAGSGGSSGISVGTAGTIEHRVTIDDNIIRGTDNGFGAIDIAGNMDSGQMFVTVTNNNVAELGAFNLSALYAIVGGAGTETGVLNLDVRGNVFDASAGTFAGNAVYLDQISPNAHYNIAGYIGSANGEFPVIGAAGTASANIDAYLLLQGNVLTNGPFPSAPGGVDASLVAGVTGDVFLLAAGPAPASAVEAGADLLAAPSLEELAGLTAAAIERWAESGVSDEQLAALEGVTVGLAELPGQALALNAKGTILIDSDAAGWGWFVDGTPFDDTEFEPGDGGALLANADGPAAGVMDLLSVLMHELGHSLGLPDLHAPAGSSELLGDLLGATLEAGERRLPADGQAGDGAPLALADLLEPESGGGLPGLNDGTTTAATTPSASVESGGTVSPLDLGSYDGTLPEEIDSSGAIAA